MVGECAWNLPHEDTTSVLRRQSPLAPSGAGGLCHARTQPMSTSRTGEPAEETTKVLARPSTSVSVMTAPGLSR